MDNITYLGNRMKQIGAVDKNLLNIVKPHLESNYYKYGMDKMNLNSLDSLVNLVIKHGILTSGVTDDEKASLLNKLGIARKPLDFGKMLESGDIKMGQGLSNDDRIVLASKYGMTPREFSESLTAARKAWMEKNHSGKDTAKRIAAQREYLYYATLGEDGEQERMRNEWKKDKEMTEFFKQSDKEMNKPSKWVAALARNIDQMFAGGAVSNKYANDVRNATGGLNENAILGAVTDYPRQLGASLAYGGLSGLSGGAGGKVASAVASKFAPGAKKIAVELAKPLLANVAGSVLQGGSELARQGMAGEALDPTKAGLVATTSLGVPSILYWGRNIVSRIPVLGGWLSRYRRDLLDDPVALKRQEVLEQMNDYSELLKTADESAIRGKVREIKPKLNDEYIGNIREENYAKRKLEEAMALYEEARKARNAARRKTTRMEKDFKAAPYSDELVDKLIAQKQAFEAAVAKQKEMLLQKQDMAELLKHRETLSKNTFDSMLKLIQDKRDELNRVLNMSDKELKDQYINIDSDWWETEIPEVQRELVKEINRKGKDVSSQVVDPIGHLGVGGARSGMAKPEYPDDRWLKGEVTDEEWESPEFHDWFLQRFGFEPTEKNIPLD